MTAIDLRESAAELGFGEKGELEAARTAWLKAIQTASLGDYRAAQAQYESAAIALQGPNPDPKAQLGRRLALAAIWLDSYDRVRYWQTLLEAEDFARQHGLYDECSSAIEKPLSQGQSSAAYEAEWCQAQGNLDDFENALGGYDERLDDECLRPLERGLLHLRMAECHLAIHHILLASGDAADADEAADAARDANKDATLAAGYLAYLPEQAQAQRFLDQLAEPITAPAN